MNITTLAVIEKEISPTLLRNQKIQLKSANKHSSILFEMVSDHVIELIANQTLYHYFVFVFLNFTLKKQIAN
jgi:uncharacterized membrane protein